jgi:hypothetical protein
MYPTRLDKLLRRSYIVEANDSSYRIKGKVKVGNMGL